MKPFQKLVVASLKEFARDRTSLSFTIILPLLLVAFFGFAYGAGSGSKLQIGIVLGGQSPTLPQVEAIRNNPHVKSEFGSRKTEFARLHDGAIDAIALFEQVAPGVNPVHSFSLFYSHGNGTVALALAALSQSSTATRRGGSHRSTGGTPSVESIHGLSNSRLDFVIPGILATAIMWLGIFAAIPLVQQREQQVLRRMAVTPLPRSRLVTAQVLARLLVSVAQAVFILGAARLLFGVPIGRGAGSWPLAAATVATMVLLGAMSFVAIGYAVAALSSTQSGAHAWAQLLTMPMLLLAGVFFPIAVMPGLLRPLIAILPLTYLADALRQTAIGGQNFAPLPVDLLALGAWVVIPLAISIRYFRWS